MIFWGDFELLCNCMLEMINYFKLTRDQHNPQLKSGCHIFTLHPFDNQINVLVIHETHSLPLKNMEIKPAVYLCSKTLN